ncbi:MAG: hypothetical protein VX211_04575, partial [Pseudomonadota bacterium]|nr:hypothetical protein [Pseudomonadota bacterium]
MLTQAFAMVFLALLIGTSTNASTFTLDIDDDGQIEALTDGLLLLRHLFGFSGESLTGGALGQDASRTDSTMVAAYLADNELQLDVDDDGQIDALTDGLLVLRNLFGFAGTSLVSGAVSADARRTDSEGVVAYINTLIDRDGDNVADSLDAFPLDPLETLDNDNDGVGNNADTDDDNDGVIDSLDPAPLNDAFSDWETYATLDLDGDGVINQYDADDDGDGIIDPLDVYASESSMAERISVKPWINEIYVTKHSWETMVLRAEIAKYAEDSCEDIFVTPFNAEGDYIGDLEGGDDRTDGTQRGRSLKSYFGYNGHVDCTGLEHVNGYGFVVATMTGEDADGLRPACYALEANG